MLLAYQIQGLTDTDNKSILNCYSQNIEMTIDEYGRIFNEAGQYIADGEKVEAGLGIACK